MKKQDLLEIRQVVTEAVNSAIDTKVPPMISSAIEANNHVLKREIRDEFHSVLKAEIFASERRMIIRMDEGFSAIIELIDDGIIPQIQEHDRAIAKLNQVVGIA